MRTRPVPARRLIVQHRGCCGALKVLSVGSFYLGHNLEEALFAIKHTLLAGWQALEMHLNFALKQCCVNGHGPTIDGQLLCRICEAVDMLQQNECMRLSAHLACVERTSDRPVLAGNIPALGRLRQSVRSLWKISHIA